MSTKLQRPKRKKHLVKGLFLQLTAHEFKLAAQVAKKVAHPGQKLTRQDAFRISLANHAGRVLALRAGQ
jgi:hypothetical protein